MIEICFALLLITQACMPRTLQDIDERKKTQMEQNVTSNINDDSLKSVDPGAPNPNETSIQGEQNATANVNDDSLKSTDSGVVDGPEETLIQREENNTSKVDVSLKSSGTFDDPKETPIQGEQNTTAGVNDNSPESSDSGDVGNRKETSIERERNATAAGDSNNPISPGLDNSEGMTPYDNSDDTQFNHTSEDGSKDTNWPKETFNNAGSDFGYDNSDETDYSEERFNYDSSEEKGWDSFHNYHEYSKY